MSPTTSQPKENDWQIVMPLKNNSNSSDPASEKSQTDEEVFISDDKMTAATASNIIQEGDITSTSNTTIQTLPSAQIQATTTTTSSSSQVVNRPLQPPPAPLGYSSSSSSAAATTSAVSATEVTDTQQPPPPPYSVAITRHLDNKVSVTTTASSGSKPTVTTTNSANRSNQQQQQPSQQQQQQQSQQQHDNFNDIEDANGRAGILPAARARLASLKSLGSKKLNAIKMRLSDNRQKIEECK